MLHGPTILGLLVPSEIAVVIVIGALLIYGKRLPELGRGLGRSIVEFKKGLSGEDEEAPKTDTTTAAKTDQNPGKPS